MSDTSERRYEGCAEAFEKNGMQFDEQTYYHTGRYSYEDGYSGMQAVLRQTPEVTAVFAMADVIAIGAIRALVDAGKRVPDDISIIGYDGLKIGSFYTPKLSTVSQSVEHLARRSFSVLMDCAERGGHPPYDRTVHAFQPRKRQKTRKQLRATPRRCFWPFPTKAK